MRIARQVLGLHLVQVSLKVDLRLPPSRTVTSREHRKHFLVLLLRFLFVVLVLLALVLLLVDGRLQRIEDFVDQHRCVLCRVTETTQHHLFQRHCVDVALEHGDNIAEPE